MDCEHDRHTKILTPWIFHLKKRTNQNWYFFYFKKIDRKFRFRDFPIDEHRWPGLQSHFAILMSFCVQTAWLHMCNRFVPPFFLCLHFYLSFYFFRGVCNCQISDVIFYIIVFWHFPDCVHMCVHDCFCAWLIGSFAFWV